MANCYQLQGEHTKALGMHEESLAMFRAHFGAAAQHPEITMSLHNTGGVHGALGQYQQAEERFLKSLDMKRSIHSTLNRGGGQNGKSKETPIN